MTAADQCEVCGRPLAPGEGQRAMVRRTERIARAALDAPREEHLAYRTKSHAVYEAPATVCPACADELDAQADDRTRYLRTTTMILGAVAMVLMAAAVTFAYFNPDAGPTILGYVWRDPYAKPKPDPGQPTTYTPYKPPFSN